MSQAWIDPDPKVGTPSLFGTPPPVAAPAPTRQAREQRTKPRPAAKAPCPGCVQVGRKDGHAFGLIRTGDHLVWAEHYIVSDLPALACPAAPPASPSVGHGPPTADPPARAVAHDLVPSSPKTVDRQGR